MRGRLIYVVGPSGAGKDSLLAWLRERLPVRSPLHFARRCITRAVQTDGEQHEPLDVAAFYKLRDADAFALHWQANGLHYGVRREELTSLQNGTCVIVNGSRAHVAETALQFPEMILLHVNASKETLRARLQARGRETPEAIEARIERVAILTSPTTTPIIEIQNDTTLDAAGEKLLASLNDHLFAMTQSGVPKRSNAELQGLVERDNA